MSIVWIVAVMLGVVPAEVPLPGEAVAPPDVTQPPLVPPRRGAELREAAHAALRRWARPRDEEAELAAREFLALYRELEADDELARSHRTRLESKIRGRLLALSRQISKRAAVEPRRADPEAPETVRLPAVGQGVLAQWGGVGRQGGLPGGFGGPMVGGFGQPFGGPAANDDYGEDLVELIQRTIAPHTWDVNGGPGSIYYWRPGRAIVVRQMGEVHDQIGDVLEQLGRMGR